MAKEYLEKLSAFVKGATLDISGEISLECKHFFSGAALYAEEKICLSLSPVGLAIKLPEETRDRLLLDGTAVPLRYFPGGPVKKDYVLFLGSVSEGSKALYGYVKESIGYVLTLPRPKSKVKKGCELHGYGKPSTMRNQS